MPTTVKSKDLSKATKAYRWGVSPGHEPVHSPAGLPAGCFERGRIRINDVRLLPHHKDLDLKIVSLIQESFPLTGDGCFQPIGVRRFKAQDSDASEIVLVFGASRLHAMKCAGHEWIDCTFLDGDDNQIKLYSLTENYFRKKNTVLDEAEYLTDFVRLAAPLVRLSGQDDQKVRRWGRPTGGTAKAARSLPAVGRSDEARRTAIRRAKKIAGIADEAKTVARESGLDDNQAALLQIAESTGLSAQISKAKELAAGIQALVSQKKGVGAAASAKSGTHQSLSQAGQQIHKDAEPEGNPTEEPDTPSAVPDTTFETLINAWDSCLKSYWAHAPFEVRERFHQMLRRARCRATVDVDKFIREIFWGRKKLDCRMLFSFAKSKGFGRKAIQAGLARGSYKRRRHGLANGPHHYVNHFDSKDEIPVFSDKEIKAAVEADNQADAAALMLRKTASATDAYYDI